MKSAAIKAELVTLPPSCGVSVTMRDRFASEALCSTPAVFRNSMSALRLSGTTSIGISSLIILYTQNQTGWYRTSCWCHLDACATQALSPDSSPLLLQVGFVTLWCRVTSDTDRERRRTEKQTEWERRTKREVER